MVYENQNTTLQVPEDGFSIIQHDRRIVQRQQNVLYLPARQIKESEFGSNKLTDLVNAMRAIMHETKGIGIAANQIGKRLQLFMIEVKEIGNPRYESAASIPVPFQVFINPKIIKSSESRINFWHGCLSAVGEQMGNVATYEWIEYEVRDMEGNIQQGKLEGLAAVIFQHELRHLLGGTYLDKASTFLSSEELNQKAKDGEESYFQPADDTLPLLINDYQIGESLEQYYQRQKI